MAKPTYQRSWLPHRYQATCDHTWLIMPDQDGPRPHPLVAVPTADPAPMYPSKRPGHKLTNNLPMQGPLPAVVHHCQVVAQVEGKSRAASRAQLISYGWRLFRDLSLCPKHSGPRR